MPDITIINRFDGQYEFLSNFHIDNEESPRTGENSYQAEKVDVNRYPEEYRLILSAKTPGQAKRLGKKCHIIDGWEYKKVGIMYKIVYKKFSTHPELKAKLLATGKAKLIEGNTWHDNDFGACSCPKCRYKVKHNYLGNILMCVRSQLRLEDSINKCIASKFEGYEL